ncbi:MAG: hypothetical protein RL297_116 [Pseudomonadota bacterium]|jgi:protein involved in polysaccharide export with SLBB domain
MNKTFSSRLALVLALSTAFGLQAPMASAQSMGATAGSASVGGASAPGVSATGAARGGSVGATGAPTITPGSRGPAALGQAPSTGAELGEQTQERNRDPRKLLPTNLQGETILNQFQNFVYENTGKLLPLYGADLFTNPEVYSANPDAMVPLDHVLGPGDEVNVQIWGGAEYYGAHVLDRNGQIALPKIGLVNLLGVQVKDMEQALRRQVARVYSNVTVTATMGRLHGTTVYVVGHAKQPGTYNVSSLSTLLNVLFASGGPTPQGTMRNIRLLRNGNEVTSLDLYAFIGKGDKSRDVRVLSGDVIMIGAAGPRVALTGAYDHEAIYEIKSNTTIADILSLGSGLPALVSPQKALLERVEQTALGSRNVRDIRLDEPGLKNLLRDGDILTLFSISPAFANAVTLQGAVAQQLRHPWTAGMRITDLIPDREALVTADYYKRKNQLVQNVEVNVTSGEYAGRIENRARTPEEEINWEYAVIERYNKNTLRIELLPFHLGRAVIHKDPAHNLELLAGDVLTIMSAADLRMPTSRGSRVVRIEGEVQSPGVYQFQPGETLRQLLTRTQGLTPQAYLFGAEFVRESVRRQQQENLDQLIRRLEAQQRNLAAKNTANSSGERAEQVRALQEQQQANLAGQIERLRELRSQGRIALELDPEVVLTAKNPLSLVPDVPLEDGDSFMIPSMRGFVAVVGHVNNENSFIYRPGKTVRDFLNTAVPMEDAELSELFVLRADGTAVNRRSVGGFGGIERLRLMPGDTVVVPAKADRETTYNFVVRSLKDWTQILLNFGLGAAAYKSLTD